jgi:hypothetical protein
LDDVANGWQLRLHVFGEEVLEAHHRAHFCARVLAGEYKQLLFGANSCLDANRLLFPLRPLFVQTQFAGSTYMIHSEMIDSTLASKNATSLMLQGLVSRSSFDVYELRTGGRRTRFGKAPSEGVREEGEHRIDVTHVNMLIKALRCMSPAS